MHPLFSEEQTGKKEKITPGRSDYLAKWPVNPLAPTALPYYKVDPYLKPSCRGIP